MKKKLATYNQRVNKFSVHFSFLFHHRFLLILLSWPVLDYILDIWMTSISIIRDLLIECCFLFKISWYKPSNHLNPYNFLDFSLFVSRNCQIFCQRIAIISGIRVYLISRRFIPLIRCSQPACHNGLITSSPWENACSYVCLFALFNFLTYVWIAMIFKYVIKALPLQHVPCWKCCIYN